MNEAAGVRVRFVVDHSPDAERIHVTEGADVGSRGLLLFLVVLSLQVVLEPVGGAVRPVVRGKSCNVTTGTGRCQLKVFPEIVVAGIVLGIRALQMIVAIARKLRVVSKVSQSGRKARLVRAVVKVTRVRRECAGSGRRAVVETGVYVVLEYRGDAVRLPVPGTDGSRFVNVYLLYVSLCFR